MRFSTVVLTRTGKIRAPGPRTRGGLWQYEIEPGRSVPNDWDKELFETWEQRKARLAHEKAMGAST